MASKKMIDWKSHSAMPLAKSERPVDAAWWYGDTKGIDVYVHVAGEGTMSCRIKRSQLAAYLKRSTPKNTRAKKRKGKG